MRITISICCALLFLAGCTAKPESDAGSVPHEDAFPAGLMLTAAPSGAQPLSAVKPAAKVGDVVTFEGQLAGQKQIFVDGAATMLVGDRTLEVCAPDEGCPKPWDCCCTPIDTRRELSATVQVVGDDGKPLPVTMRGLGSLEEMKRVVVTGTVSQKNDGGVMVVDASGIYVEDLGAPQRH